MVNPANRNKKYRTRIEIVEDMLNAALEGTSKTKMMFAAYLSGSQLKEYMALVLQAGLLEYDKKQMKYFVTAKGREFLHKINDLKI